MEKFKSAITGHLDILVTQNEDELNDDKMYWNEVLIHGDPEGLRFLAGLLLKLADLDQEGIASLPIGARAHELCGRSLNCQIVRKQLLSVAWMPKGQKLFMIVIFQMSSTFPNSV